MATSVIEVEHWLDSKSPLSALTPKLAITPENCASLISYECIYLSGETDLCPLMVVEEATTTAHPEVSLNAPNDDESPQQAEFIIDTSGKEASDQSVKPGNYSVIILASLIEQIEDGKPKTLTAQTEVRIKISLA